MKLFLLRLAAFTALFMLLSALAQCFVSAHYGNDCYRSKLEHFRLDPRQYNTVFFGSSKTFRHVDPTELDRRLAKHGIVSFNFGSPASFNPETYFLLEHFLEEAPPSLRYVVMELQPLGNIDARNLNTPRSFYWQNPRYLGFALSYVADSEYSARRKFSLTWSYAASLLLKHLNFLNYKAVKGAAPDAARSFLGIDQRGFVSLDEELENSPDDQRVRNRRDELSKQKKALDYKLAAAKRDFEPGARRAALNQPHLRKLQELIALAERKGIRLFFLIPPLMSDYAELLAVQAALGTDRVIEIASRERFPELYEIGHIFDLGHLNREGAELFTADLARELDRILGK